VGGESPLASNTSQAVLLRLRQHWDWKDLERVLAELTGTEPPPTVAARPAAAPPTEKKAAPGKTRKISTRFGIIEVPISAEEARLGEERADEGRRAIDVTERDKERGGAGRVPVETKPRPGEVQVPPTGRGVL